MKFLCLGYYNGAVMDARPPAEIEAIMGQCAPHLDTFYGTGRVVMDAGLEPIARHLTSTDGGVRVTDDFVATGPLTICGASIIEAPDMDGAIAIASQHPCVQVEAGRQFEWTLEIRPIHSSMPA